MDGKQVSSIKGQGLVEYAIILVLVATVVVIVLAILGPAIGNIFSYIMDPFGEGGVLPPDDGDLPGGDDDPGHDSPGECYSTLLIAIMVGAMWIATSLEGFFPKETIRKLTLAIFPQG